MLVKHAIKRGSELRRGLSGGGGRGDKRNEDERQGTRQAKRLH